MNRSERVGAAADLLKSAAAAHHREFAESDGVDPEWPLWYARYLVEPLAKLVDAPLTQTELVTILVALDAEYQATAPANARWPEYYATQIVDRRVSEANEQLALYHYDGCPYCDRVRAVIDTLEIDVVLRDIWEEPEHRAALIAARGRPTVPVLRCVSDERDRWMPESAEIIQYLRARFGASTDAT